MPDLSADTAAWLRDQMRYECERRDRLADELAFAIQAFMRGDGDFADRMAEAVDKWDAARNDG